jgi:transposase
MRKSFHGLLALVQRVFTADPYSGNLFVFVNRRGNYVKILAWDRTGFALYAKRLERGRFVFPSASTRQEISEQTLRFLLDGIPLGGRHAIR